LNPNHDITQVILILSGHLVLLIGSLTAKSVTAST